MSHSCTATTTAHSPRIGFGFSLSLSLSFSLGFAFGLTLGSAPSPLTVTSPFYDYYYIFVVVVLLVVIVVAVGFCDHCGILTPQSTRRPRCLLCGFVGPAANWELFLCMNCVKKLVIICSMTRSHSARGNTLFCGLLLLLLKLLWMPRKRFFSEGIWLKRQVM